MQEKVKAQFYADKNSKKKVLTENRKHRRGLYYLWIFEKVLLTVVIALIVIFPIYCKVSGTFVSTNMRTGEISYELVSMFTSIIAGMGLTAVLLISVFRKRLESVTIGGRVDETIEILDGRLFYTFRIKYQTLDGQRNLVIIDLNSIKNIGYDNKLFEISIEGMMVEKIVGISSDVHNIKASEMTNSIIKFWDYFTPSLYEFLKSNFLRA